MRHPRGAALGALTALSLCCSASPALAISGAPGGAEAPAAPQAGGSEFGTPLSGSLAPVVTALSIPGTAAPGPPPRVTLRIEERGTATVYVQVAVYNLLTRKRALLATMGWSHTGRTLSVAWPAGARLAAGSYHVSVSAHDHHGRSLLRRAHTSGVATLVVAAPAPAPSPSIPATVEAGVPTPAQTVADGAVFPVAGPHNFGGPENRYGAPREGHIHEGQDVLTAEGTPDVAPLPGTITWTDYQAGGRRLLRGRAHRLRLRLHVRALPGRLARGRRRRLGHGRAAAVPRGADRRRDRAAPPLRDVGRRLAEPNGALDRPAALSRSLGTRRELTAAPPPAPGSVG